MKNLRNKHTTAEVWMKNTAVMLFPVGSWGELRLQMPGKTEVCPNITLNSLTQLALCIWQYDVTLML